MIIDIIILAVVIIFAIIGIKRGFIKEIVSLIGAVVAISLSFWLAGLCSDFIYDKLIEEKVSTKISQTIIETADNSLNSIEDNIPDSLLKAAELLKIDVSSVIGNDVSESLEATAESVANNLMKSIVQPMCTKFILVISFIILFILLMVIISLVAKALNVVAKLPVLNSLNRLLGGIVVALRGAVIIVAVCYILYILASIFENGIFGVGADYFKQSEILKLVIK